MRVCMHAHTHTCMHTHTHTHTHTQCSQSEKVGEHVKSRHSACAWGGRQTETERQRQRKKQSRTGETHSATVTKNSSSQLSLWQNQTYWHTNQISTPTDRCYRRCDTSPNTPSLAISVKETSSSPAQLQPKIVDNTISITSPNVALAASTWPRP